MTKHVLHESEIAAKSLPGRDHKMVVGPYEGQLPCAAMCGGVAFFPPRSHAPAHIHPHESEIIYILSGHGAIYFNGAPEAVKPGDFVSIPPQTEHSIRNDADETMKLLYVFSPPVRQGSYDNQPTAEEQTS